jgi:hypothetical protein
MVYLQRNTQTGTAVSSLLGEGEFLGHTCVYGTPPGPGTPAKPAGWFMDVQWTAANGDVLLATSEFQEWAAPGQAVEKVTFIDGGTGRFKHAAGTATSRVNAPGRAAAYDGTLKYGTEPRWWDRDH